MTANQQRARRDSVKKHVLFVSDPSIKSLAAGISLYRHYLSLDKSYYTSVRMSHVRMTWIRQQYKENETVECWLCKTNVIREQASLDHIIPLRDGGAWRDPSNFAVAHKVCNHNRDYLFPESLENPQEVKLTPRTKKFMKFKKLRIRKRQKRKAKQIVEKTV